MFDMAKNRSELRVRRHARMEQLTLAPAAGSGIGKQLADRLLAREDFLQLMEDAAIDGLRAMAPRRWDKDTQKWISDPDMRTRTTMFFGIIAQMEGEPVKRIIHQHIGTGDKADPVAALHDSPALVEAVERALANAKFRTRNVKPAKPADQVAEWE